MATAPRGDGAGEGDPAAAAQRREKILRARAEGLALRREHARLETVALVGFRVGGESYALRLEHAREVLELAKLAPLPGVGRHVLGAAATRAAIVPVIDLRQLLGLATGGMVDLPWILVIDGASGALGLAVEEVEGRLDVPAAELGPPPAGPFSQLAPGGRVVIDPRALARRIAEG